MSQFRWFMPSFAGDFRLEPVESKPDQCALVVVEPTLHELDLVNAFLAKAKKKKWLEEATQLAAGDSAYRTRPGRRIVLSSSVAKAGSLLAKLVRPKKATLTAVKFANGRLETVEGTGEALDELAAKTEQEPAKAAATVSRPTPSCPACVPGSVEMASEVLLEFLDDEQHADWARHRAIMVYGGLTGRRYLVAHRHSETAQRNGRITYDVDGRSPVHFHDSMVPPEEEVLAAKLILEHREHWLRNEATIFGFLGFEDGGDIEKFKNPFGDITDGILDAKFSDGFGRGVAASLGIDLGPDALEASGAITLAQPGQLSALAYMPGPYTPPDYP